MALEDVFVAVEDFLLVVLVLVPVLVLLELTCEPAIVQGVTVVRSAASMVAPGALLLDFFVVVVLVVDLVCLLDLVNGLVFSGI